MWRRPNYQNSKQWTREQDSDRQGYSAPFVYVWTTWCRGFNGVERGVVSYGGGEGRDMGGVGVRVCTAM